jgi:hypothetical protein
MVKSKFLPIIIIPTLLLLTIFSNNVSANSAGVGVVNVPPKYGQLRIVQNDDTIRVYLIISDYNSWGDVFKISIILEDKYTDQEYATFVFQQYEDQDSFDQINSFTEIGGNEVLLTEKCSVTTSNKKDTIDDRCDIELLFVFNTMWFTRLKVIVEDREGEQATSEIDTLYSDSDEQYRSENIIIIPWFDGSRTFIIPPYLSNLLAVIAGLLGAGLCFRKKYKLYYRKLDYERL